MNYHLSKRIKTILSAIIVFVMMLSFTSCNGTGEEQKKEESGSESVSAEDTSLESDKDSESSNEAEKNGEIYILYTSDIHCSIDGGFGFVGLAQVRESLEKKGYTTILVDNGDAIQGEISGTLSKGEAIISLMNDAGYDVATMGNHEFDYGMEQFLSLSEMADFPYVSCNFNREGELLFEPYIIKEVCGKKIAFVGVTTPATLVTSTPANFMDEDGELVYGFLQDDTGENLYEAVQKAVDDARSQGADLVYVLGHMGMKANSGPWTYMGVIENTTGIDVFLDGHSHDTEQVVMLDKEGRKVVRTACGTKLANIGYSHISAEGEILDTGIWTWTNDPSLPELLDIENEMTEKVEAVKENIEEQTSRVIAESLVDLTIYDPEAKDKEGNPIRMVRRAETNLGNFCADAVRFETGADIAFINGGGIRDNIKKGQLTYGDVLKVWPFENNISVIEASGQQILDALEWGARNIPDENGGFLQPSGFTYEVDLSVSSNIESSEDGIMISISGERRIKNVMVGQEPLDPEKIYTVASSHYILQDHGDGYSVFDGATIISENFGVDHQVLMDYINDALEGVIGEEYADPYGQGRIRILE